MRRAPRAAFRAATALAAAMVPVLAWPCGGFFAQGVEVAPSQKIVVVHRDGVENYVFRPHFCGVAKDFGVILPIPATLTASPSLADNALFEQLDSLTAPSEVKACLSSSSWGGCGAGSAGSPLPGGESEVNVVNRGRVGIFDFVLLQATSSAAFTDWLDQNGFPYAGSPSVYADYVARRWYFVAFKVTADVAPPPAGMRLCGDLGPIQVSFASERPVIPARIASVNQRAGSPPVWRVFAVARAQQRLGAAASAFQPTLYFSGALGAAELGGHAAVAAVARADDRLTVLDVTFPYDAAVSGDIGLEDDTSTMDFRSTTHVNDASMCSAGCGTGGDMPVGTVAALIGAWLLGTRRQWPPRS